MIVTGSTPVQFLIYRSSISLNTLPRYNQKGLSSLNNEPPIPFASHGHQNSLHFQISRSLYLRKLEQDKDLSVSTNKNYGLYGF